MHESRDHHLLQAFPSCLQVLHIFGPPGIQDLLESTLGFSGSRLAMPVVVAEFTVQPEKGAPPVPSKGFSGMSCAFIAPDFTERAKQALQQTNVRPRPDYRRDDQMALHGVRTRFCQLCPSCAAAASLPIKRPCAALCHPRTLLCIVQDAECAPGGTSSCHQLRLASMNMSQCLSFVL